MRAVDRRLCTAVVRTSTTGFRRRLFDELQPNITHVRRTRQLIPRRGFALFTRRPLDRMNSSIVLLRIPAMSVFSRR